MNDKASDQTMSPDKEMELLDPTLRALIAFWRSLRDDKNGGSYGRVRFNGSIEYGAEKSCILNSRILWFFSNAAMYYKDECCLDEARHAFDFLKTAFWDSKHGGVFWSVKADGSPADRTKHSYCQAFAIYGLSAYGAASGDRDARQLAAELIEVIQTRCRDDGGYLEAFSEDFQPVANEKLSENGVNAVRTMNSLLHIFEAYSEYYALTNDAQIAGYLREILHLFREKIYNPDKERLEVFFDKDYHSLIDLHSYGHDIEAAWLLRKGCRRLNDPQLNARVFPMLDALADCVLRSGIRDGSLMSENEKGIDKTERVWWVQCEAATGFYDAWQVYPEKATYLKAATGVLHFIGEKIIDSRSGGEWFWSVDDHGVPSENDIVSPWKCPYHNGRMCLELLRRTHGEIL